MADHRAKPRRPTLRKGSPLAVTQFIGFSPCGLWALYEKDLRRDTKGAPWANLKLVSRQEVLGKANWHIAVSLKNGRIAITSETRRFESEYPELAEWVATRALEYYGNKRLPSVEDFL